MDEKGAGGAEECTGVSPRNSDSLEPLRERWYFPVALGQLQLGVGSK